MIGKVLAGGVAVVLVVPVVATLAAFGVGARSGECIDAATATYAAAAPTDGATWADDPISGAAQENPDPALSADDGAIAASSGNDCIPRLGTGTVVVPPGTPVVVSAAVRNALAYVGVRSGWHQLCDRLACRAYGYVGSGYVSAKAHWQVMVADGYAHPVDRCPPLGSFVFWNTGRPYGHVSLVVAADPVGCDPERIQVTSNGVFDAATGNHGGVYLLSFARLDRMYQRAGGYLGWSPPICAGALLPAGTVHPAPSGR